MDSPSFRLATHVNGGDRHEAEARRFASTVPEGALPSTEEAGASPTAEGRPLGPAAREYLEGRLGVGLSGVRVRDDAGAAADARSLSAHGYARGDEVVLGAGAAGRTAPPPATVLAHELAHVAQQSGGAARAGLSATPAGIQKWDSFEHVELGDESKGGPSVLITLEAHDRDFRERADRGKWPPIWKTRLASATPDQIRVATKGLTYGEVVALSGDFYGTFTDASGAKRSPFDALDIAPLEEIVRLIPLIHGHATTSQLQKATAGRYLDLAQQNVSHFSNVPDGQRNIDVWLSMHRDAVMLAQQGAANPSLVNRAWAMNAAADHFLTDAFSSGHLRTPRAKLLAQGVLGNIESKILHDLDNTYGVEVTNLRGIGGSRSATINSLSEETQPTVDWRSRRSSSRRRTSRTQLREGRPT